jgi:nucleotide-binding universal stress UspA family protein
MARSILLLDRRRCVMAERILVPLDGSPLGEAALNYLGSLLKKITPESDVTVILFHVSRTPYTRFGGFDGDIGALEQPYTEEEIAILKKQSQEYLDRIAERVQVHDNIKVQTMVVPSDADPADSIIRAENEHNCDLVCMSTHGRSGLSRWAFGSVTDRVLRAGSVPVLLVRAKDSQ